MHINKIHPLKLFLSFYSGINKLIDYAVEAAKEQGFVRSGEQVIVILGSNEEDPDQGDILKIKEVEWKNLLISHERKIALACFCFYTCLLPFYFFLANVNMWEYLCIVSEAMSRNVWWLEESVCDSLCSYCACCLFSVTCLWLACATIDRPKGLRVTQTLAPEIISISSIVILVCLALL